VVFHLAFNVVNVALLPVTASTEAFALLTAFECAISLALIGRLTQPSARERLAAVGKGPAREGPAALDGRNPV
jgi:hypothetical protein